MRTTYRLALSARCCNRALLRTPSCPLLSRGFDFGALDEELDTLDDVAIFPFAFLLDCEGLARGPSVGVDGGGGVEGWSSVT